ncbi:MULTISPECIES: nitric oxide reductase transcriptional regulator NorR [Thalassolituus]|jgi:anaerobic nitric oxide reductase transcription regulator|uniref:nitric oxide reductase transcriptional regulator NorR n=1 Tax=Thalassolituus TaxID=187492 RepID=UPI001CE31E79|nr:MULTISPECIES: nitric oxide reductase transcriptional regulator NorR [Thalassolituus]MCA6058650.1 nitric oxide reductase transcriptional regulator NorR [Thalassolituus sp. ST750PaO-4]MCB2388033.1 nitric oxide reductase transcriptional regulator NorR [Thalassolituus alkanivorans]MCB2424547.1 nitric oxide reductase transcriptional regulator NorR [Thalassolituus alkanivorans]
MPGQQLLTELIKDMPAGERFDHIVKSIRTSFNCGAVALLRLQGEYLRPVAVSGLVTEAHGRKFSLAQHPRLSAVMTTSHALRFPPDSPLPDPYDGLLETQPGEALPVHDCMGTSLWLNGERWGALTLDSLTPGTFDQSRIDELDSYRPVLETAIRISMLEEEIRGLRRVRLDGAGNIAIGTEADNEIIGNSSAIRQIKKELEVVAASDLPVLLLGETGVGKEIFASYTHRLSARAARPMVYINCAALPEHLAESELFGHVKGAFSGATSDRAGRFETADKSTLFLDEVGELPLPVQAKLLRVLQNGEIQRLGSDKTRHVDVRILAATNRNLKEQITEGAFRADLYHRLSVYPIPIPPLRERGQDIPLLAGHFLELNRTRLGLRSLRLSADAEAALQTYPWPGNIRELEHVISRAAIKALSRGAQRHDIVTLDCRSLDLELPTSRHHAHATGEDSSDSLLKAVQGMPMKEAVKYFQQTLVLHELQQQQGSWSKTARALGMDPSNLHKLAQKLGLK